MIMKMNPTKNDSSPTLLKIRRHSNGMENRETHRAEFEMRVEQIGLSHIVKMFRGTRLCDSGERVILVQGCVYSIGALS